MNRIGIVDVDGTKFPNLALMKISTWHKQQGDNVEFANPLFGNYDRVYQSKVFTFTPDINDIFNCEVIKGGTGYDITSKLPDEIDRLQPDYSLYGITDTAFGFLTRGCVNRCKWCIVPVKEGQVRPYMTIDEIATRPDGTIIKNAVLMDNNVLSCDYGIEQLRRIAELGVRVDFNQGLDARQITPEIAELLASVKWIQYIRLACDTSAQIPYIIRAKALLMKFGYHGQIFVYTLIQDFNETINRLLTLRQFDDICPFAQPYRDFNDPKQIIPQWQKDLARWCNMRAIYKTVELSEYEPRKGFKFAKYFQNQY